jgi:hypothetical protein
MTRYGLIGLACALVFVGSALAAPSSHRSGPVLKVGQSRTFTAASLPAGASVRCVNRRHTLSLSVPSLGSSPWQAQGRVWTKPGTQTVHLYLTVRHGRGYTASCGLLGFHW